MSVQNCSLYTHYWPRAVTNTSNTAEVILSAILTKCRRAAEYV